MASSAETTLNQSASLLPPPTRPIAEYHPPARLQPDLEARSIVDYSPSEIVRRHSAAWSGLHVETVEVMQHKPFEYGFRAPCHLLIAAELADRYDGETFVEGLPRSTLRNFTRKLTFVPAGHDFRGSQRPRVDAYTLFLHRPARASRRSRAAVRRDRIQAAAVLLRSRSLGDRSQAQVAGREPGLDATAIRRSARHSADSRARSHQR